MRIFIVFLLSVFLCGTAYAENYVAAEPKGLCGKWLTNPSGIALVDGDQKVYVTDASANRVLVISPRSRHVEKIIKTKEPTHDIVPAANGQRAYVLSGSASENMVLVFDTATDKIIETIALGAGYAK
jgi:DNA-binding beta-propeller fold protein YncE